MVEVPGWIGHLDLTDVGIAEVYGMEMMPKQTRGNFGGDSDGIC